MTISAHRSRLIWSPLIGWVLLSCGVPAVNAQSPIPSDVDPTASTTPTTVPPGGAAPIIVTPGGTPGTQSPPARTTASEPVVLPPLAPSAGMTIVNAPFGTTVPYYGGISSLGQSTATGGVGRPSDEGGIGLGAFTLTPIIEINVGTDSNVFAQNSSSSQVRSLYTTVSPSLDLKSDWSNHMLHVLASGTFGWYNSASSQNFQNYNLLVDGKIDIHHDIWATWAIGFRRATEALGTPDVAFAQAPTIVDTVPLELGVHQEFNDFFYEIGLKAIRYFHYDNSTITASGLPADSRNRWEYGETLRLGYHVNPDLDIFLSPSFGQIRYLEKINAAGQQRDSDDLNVNLGATWRLNAISFLEGSVGLATKNDPTQGSNSTLAYSLKGTWTGYSPLTLRPTISRTINETALSNYKNYVQTTYAVDATYEIHNEWTLAGGLLFQTADYNPAVGSTAGPRTDYFLRGQIGLLYSLKPEVQIGPFFEYSKGSSTDTTLGPSYDRQVFSIRLIAKR